MVAVWTVVVVLVAIRDAARNAADEPANAVPAKDPKDEAAHQPLDARDVAFHHCWVGLFALRASPVDRPCAVLETIAHGLVIAWVSHHRLLHAWLAIAWLVVSRITVGRLSRVLLPAHVRLGIAWLDCLAHRLVLLVSLTWVAHVLKNKI